MELQKFTKHLIYWILPSLLMLTCMLLYFYNINGLATYIAPAHNREFGVIENLQLILLAGIFTVAIQGIRRKDTKAERYGYMLLAFLSVFFFLEEIDYGLHYYEWLTGKTKEEVEYQILVQHQVRNIHNIGSMNSLIKFLVYLFTALLLVVIPLLPKRILQRHAWINYFAPSRYIIGTAIALFLLNQTALYLNTVFYDQHIGLAGNVSEFEEVMNYYIFLLYAKEMVNKKQTMPATKPNFAWFCGWREKSHQ